MEKLEIKSDSIKPSPRPSPVCFSIIFDETKFMAEVKFVLKEPNATEETLVYLIYRFNNLRLKYSTSIKILPKFWNPDSQKARDIRSFRESASINETLDNLIAAVKNAHRDLINANKTPTPAKIKEVLEKTQFKGEYTQTTGFLKFIDDYIAQSNKKNNTTKGWKQTLKKLHEFKKEAKYEIDYDTINQDFYNLFIKFLNKKGHALNTVGNHIKTVKIFMNEAVARKLTSNLEYRDRKFKVLIEKIDSIYLNTAEINAIYRLDLSKNKKLEKVRDLFIIACYTGLRFSDLIEVRSENIQKDNLIKIRTEKTKELVVIPIHPFVREIINKYGGGLPAAISNQKMNDYLKKIAEKAGLSATHKVATTRGGITNNKLFKKFQLVTTHTARRSFATNAYLNDVPSISIMKITGHKTEASFMSYIRISQEDNANKLVNHPFFN